MATSLGAAALTAAALVGAAPTAVGGGSTITASGPSVTPASTKVSQGTSVSWSFSGGVHTTTSNQEFWESGSRSSGSFSKTLPSAGKFPYHCTFHVSLGMKGTIKVPLKATGAPDTGWTIRWSRSPVAAGRSFDVQYRRVGTTTWRSFRTDTTAASALFNPTRSATYQLRARTTNTAATPDKSSGWSPVLKRVIS